MDRIQKDLILRDLEKKMVFLTGPRQVGKTWLAKEIAKSSPNAVYLNYNSFEDRENIRNEAWLNTTDLLILDELHKMPSWKNYSNLSLLFSGLRPFRKTLPVQFSRSRSSIFSIPPWWKAAIAHAMRIWWRSLFFNKKYNIPGMQVVLNLKRGKTDRGIVVRDARGYLTSLSQ